MGGKRRKTSAERANNLRSVRTAVLCLIPPAAALGGSVMGVQNAAPTDRAWWAILIFICGVIVLGVCAAIGMTLLELVKWNTWGSSGGYSMTPSEQLAYDIVNEFESRGR